MGKFEFLKQFKFVKLYLVVTLIILPLTLISNLFGFSGNLTIQSIAGVLTLIGIPLMIGQILLIMTLANKGDPVGWMVVRLSYITLIVACLGLLLITIATFAFSLISGSSGSLLLGPLFSTVGITIMFAFGIFFAALTFYTLSLENAWTFIKQETKVKGTKL